MRAQDSGGGGSLAIGATIAGAIAGDSLVVSSGGTLSQVTIVFNVLLYGAVGDGVTDDTAAIQAAINAATDGYDGGVVLFPSQKTFLCSGQLLLDASRSVSLVGSVSPGAGGLSTSNATILFSQGGTAALISARGTQGFRLRGMRIMNTNAAFTGAMVDLSGLTGEDTDFVVVESCQIQGASAAVGNAAYCLYMHQCISSTIRDCQFSYANVGIYGVNIAGYSNDINIICNQFVFLITAAIQNAGQGWLILGNTWEASQTSQACGYMDTPTYGGAYGPVTFLQNRGNDASVGGVPWIQYWGNSLQILGNFFPTAGGTTPCIVLGSTHSAMQGVSISGNSFEGPFAYGSAGTTVDGYGEISAFFWSGNHLGNGTVSFADQNLLLNPVILASDNVSNSIAPPVTFGNVVVLEDVTAIPTNNPVTIFGRSSNAPGTVNGCVLIVTPGNGGGTNVGLQVWTGDGVPVRGLALDHILTTLNTSLVIAPPVSSVGAPGPGFGLTTPGYTALTASTEFININLNSSATQTFVAGNIATLRNSLTQAPTYAASGTSVIAKAATHAVTGAPIAGTHVTITSPYTYWAQSGLSSFDGGMQATANNHFSPAVVAIALQTLTATIIHGSVTSDVAAVTTSAAHGFLVGETVVITGLSGALAFMNGTWVITAVNPTLFEFAVVNANLGTTNGSGTATVAMSVPLHPFRGYSSTATLRDLAYLDAGFTTPTDASYTGYLRGMVQDFNAPSGGREGWRMTSNGTAVMVSLFGVTPIVQPTANGLTTGFTAGSGTTMTSASTSTGGVGSSAYTYGDVVAALKGLGMLAN